MIYPHEFRILFTLELAGPSTARQIHGEHLPDVAAAAQRMGSTLVSLHKRGLITRWTSPRPMVWTNTRAGRAIVRADEVENVGLR